MKHFLFTYFSILLLAANASGNNYTADNYKKNQQSITDTLPEDIKKEDEQIEEVIKSRTAPKKEKIQL